MNDILRAQKIIESRKENAEKEYENKLASLKNEEVFSDLYSRVSYLRFEMARLSVFEKDIPEEMRVEYAEKSRLVAESMAKVGLVNGERPNYTCPICNDTGYVENRLCECVERARVDLVLSDYPILKNQPKLDEIDFSFYGAEMDGYKKRASFLQKRFLDGSLNFCTIIGAPGSAKTYLSLSIIKSALYGGKSVKVINMVKLNRAFLDYHLAPIADKNGLWEDIVDSDVLLIDDLGVESLINNVTEQYLYELISERADKKTVITTNLSLSSLDSKYGQRITSRLCHKEKGAVIEVTGKDYRR